jgi:hypothetical protein
MKQLLLLTILMTAAPGSCPGAIRRKCWITPPA